ncbi:PREDICTED: B3 domain-containing protein At2g33720-like [Nelumbo nucifera]|uniref:B3 domain-containing protein At2g33720-like n=2 Tax=Nelumbo nucifera TaxID=4432 RepID=A0A1U8A374_NELNU|nr:PREDICTED: B3 domain-containing protein At2g33720-like [Nelumbo nucifera]DAD18920.1 TPA_asm: hypothetical protein HUJ06_020383 [Nelumbo nucifera]
MENVLDLQLKLGKRPLKPEGDFNFLDAPQLIKPIPVKKPHLSLLGGANQCKGKQPMIGESSSSASHSISRPMETLAETNKNTVELEPVFYNVPGLERINDRPVDMNRNNLLHLQENEPPGISTALTLHEDRYVIRKKLKVSDVNGLSRLLLGTNLVQRFILPFLGAGEVERAENGEGTRVVIKDVETNTNHELTFKKWSTSNSYVLVDNWNAQFVKRRDLQARDEIGMYWDPYYDCFLFAVIKRAPHGG